MVTYIHNSSKIYIFTLILVLKFYLIINIVFFQTLPIILGYCILMRVSGVIDLFFLILIFLSLNLCA